MNNPGYIEIKRIDQAIVSTFQKMGLDKTQVYYFKTCIKLAHERGRIRKELELLQFSTSGENESE